ncbi:MAG: hypothetical protein ACRC6X_05050 [Culicoidibacterales bacterium]
MKKQYIIIIIVIALIVGTWGGMFVYSKLINRYQYQKNNGKSLSQSNAPITFQRDRRVMSPWTTINSEGISIAFNGIGTTTSKFDSEDGRLCHSHHVFGFSLKNVSDSDVVITKNNIIYDILGEKKESKPQMELFSGGRGEVLEAYIIPDVFPMTIAPGEIGDIEVGFDVTLPGGTKIFKVLWYYQTTAGLVAIDTGKDMEMVCS